MNGLKKISRDENGLIIGVEYKFTPEGLVDWKAMIPSKFLYINNDPKRRDKIEKKYGKTYSELDPIKDNIDDSDLVQQLGATKFLLNLRGFDSVEYKVIEANENYAAVSCFIHFISNFESENKPVLYSDNACAHFGNTNGFGQKYLLEMSSNRALARCVRSFLRINIINKEELFDDKDFNDNNSGNSPSINPNEILSSCMEQKHLTFDAIKKKLIKSGIKAENFTKIEDIPPLEKLTLIEQIKKYNPAI